MYWSNKSLKFFLKETNVDKWKLTSKDASRIIQVGWQFNDPSTAKRSGSTLVVYHSLTDRSRLDRLISNHVADTLLADAISPTITDQLADRQVNSRRYLLNKYEPTLL
jgi:hypothetical protein